jgi:hypothetical protein
MIRLEELFAEATLITAERGDTLLQQRRAIANGDKRAHFTEAEIAKREKRMPRLRALRKGMEALIRRRDEIPEWILNAFEGSPE